MGGGTDSVGRGPIKIEHPQVAKEDATQGKVGKLGQTPVVHIKDISNSPLGILERLKAYFNDLFTPGRKAEKIQQEDVSKNVKVLISDIQKQFEEGKLSDNEIREVIKDVKKICGKLSSGRLKETTKANLNEIRLSANDLEISLLLKGEFNGSNPKLLTDVDEFEKFQAKMAKGNSLLKVKTNLSSPNLNKLSSVVPDEYNAFKSAWSVKVESLKKEIGELEIDIILGTPIDIGRYKAIKKEIEQLNEIQNKMTEEFAPMDQFFGTTDFDLKNLREALVSLEKSPKFKLELEKFEKREKLEAELLIKPNASTPEQLKLLENRLAEISHEIREMGKSDNLTDEDKTALELLGANMVQYKDELDQNAVLIEAAALHAKEVADKAKKEAS